MNKIGIASIMAVIGGVVGSFIGVTNELLIALITFVIVDYITGVIKAIVNRELSSEFGAQGIAKKIGIFVVVGVANIIDTSIIGDSSAIRTMAIFFYLANEGISILENCASIGVPIPSKIIIILQQLKEDEENDEQGNDNDVYKDEWYFETGNCKSKRQQDSRIKCNKRSNKG